MLGFVAFGVAQVTLTGIELLYRCRKGKLEGSRELGSALRPNCSTPWLPKGHPGRGKLTA
jgi:hypothetical protein